jgi:hypothetical protein
VRTLERERIALAPTPQAFRYAWLRDAYERAAREKWAVTDDASLVEGINGLVSIVSGNGGVRLVNVSGGTGVKALEGDVEISTKERSWRGGNLVVVATNGNVRFSAPAGFAAVFAMNAVRGIALALGDDRKTFEATAREATGVGGAELQLTASGTIEVTLRDP